MPEGPEIRRAADRIDAAIGGKRIHEVWFAFEHLERWAPKLAGRRVRRVEPRGKAMLVRFAGGLNLYSHNQLYGRWYVVRGDRSPSTRRQLRVALRADDAAALLYSASDIEVLKDRELAEHPYLKRLGPDLLDPDTTRANVARHVAEDRFARRALGGLLLDQGFLGGVGNYLRSEILFAAGLDPARRPGELTDAQRVKLARVALQLARRSYRTGGITNTPAAVRRLKAAGTPRRDYRHLVFGRAGQPCPVCKTGIEKRAVAGRRLYACARCQR